MRISVPDVILAKTDAKELTKRKVLLALHFSSTRSASVVSMFLSAVVVATC